MFCSGKSVPKLVSDDNVKLNLSIDSATTNPIMVLFWGFYYTSNSTISANDRMEREQEEMFGFRCGRKTLIGKPMQSRTENLIHIQSYGLK